MSFSPRTGLVYLHVYDAPMKIHNIRPAIYELGAIGQSTSGSFPPFDDPADKELLAKQHLETKFEGRLKAWNPITGKAAWQTEPLTFVSGGTMEQGRKPYETYCHRCHTMGGSVCIFPNLWSMPPAVIESFEGIVEGGAYTYAGMSSFSNILSHDDIEAIKSFIVNDTIAAKAKGADAASRSRQATH